MSSRDNTGEGVVKYIAKLARLALSSEEITLFGGQLSDILNYISKLNEVDTENIEPTSHVEPLQNVEREDVVKPSLPIGEVLKNAPSKEGNFFKVPKVIE